MSYPSRLDSIRADSRYLAKKKGRRITRLPRSVIGPAIVGQHCETRAQRLWRAVCLQPN